MKLNCWEAKQCGRQPGGVKIEEFGICPAAIIDSVDGINNGVNGGRACWTITGTLCGNKIQGNFIDKLHECLKCDFYFKVRNEEGVGYMSSKEIMERL